MKVSVTDGNQNIIIGTHEGLAVSFHESKVRNMGRTARGVRGIRVAENDFVVGMDLLKDDSEVLVITENGYGKRTAASEYAIRGRGGNGVKTANITEKIGKLVGLTTVNGEEDIMLITINGILIRMDVNDISTTGRSTQGVRLIRLSEDETVATVARVKKDIDIPEDAEEAEEGDVETALIEESAEADVFAEDGAVADEEVDHVEEELEEDEE
jgi:DNA gyrase subunit A